MLVSLARYHKCIAWFFMGLIYLELVLIPVAARSEGRTPMAFKPGSSYGLDLPYLKDRAAWSTGKQPVNGFKPPMASTLLAYNATPLATAAPRFHAAGPAAVAGTGPGQPEMNAFTSVGSANMVDLFSGDFSYNIPLLDVGGYPVNLAYRAGVTMDQDASWVGLGWNVNPGTISRNMRGLPDDFNGRYDTVRKIMSIKENKTVGVTAGGSLEIAGFPVDLNASQGITHNNYRGWGLEHSLNASINAGKSGMGTLTAGLSVTNSSMDGVTLTPSFSAAIAEKDAKEHELSTLNFSVSAPYNSRSGLRALQLGFGAGKSKVDQQNQNSKRGYEGNFSTAISFNSPSYTPSITLPYTSFQISYKAKVGGLAKVAFANLFTSAYISKQYIARADTLLELPSYGYLHYQTGAQNRASLLDFNREKEMPYREKPAIPHIAIPAYTYDAFSITGEGTGGMFQAYRGDIGFIHDHFIRTKDLSGRLDVEAGPGDLVHAGFDLNINRVITQNGPWLNQNVLKQATRFRTDSADFQAVYFRNPGEKSINDKQFYETLGGDDVVTVGLAQENKNSSIITATNYLWRYKENGRANGQQQLSASNAVKAQRDKRTQVISYLTAQEAEAVGLSKYIEYHKMNQFDSASCVEPSFGIDSLTGSGLRAEYYKGITLRGKPDYIRQDPNIAYDWFRRSPDGVPGFPGDYYSVRWTGRLKAPVTGTYIFYTTSDDGARFWLNDSLLIDDWGKHSREDGIRSDTVYLEAGKMYNVKLEYKEEGGISYMMFEWQHKNSPVKDTVPRAFLYPPPAVDTFEHNYIVREQRVNQFRKAGHISEIDVLNNDGRRYVYGIPVYNLKQKEVTFAVDKDKANRDAGLVGYVPGTDNTTANKQGKDNYYNSEEMTAYAHSYLLTGILSADYSDITGNGITDDDMGDAVKFNYTKVAGIVNPYKWRTPAVEAKASYSEGLRTDSRDDKGNYIAGEKELWYMHSIESKTMVATFILEERDDLPAYGENGERINSHAAKRLKEIRLYSKSDFAAKRTAAIPVKTVHFRYSYKLCAGVYGPGTGKLTLDSLWFTYNGNNKGKQNPYVFHYNNNNPAYSQQSNDRWGSYKDPLQNPGSTSGNLISNVDYPYSVQDSLTAAQNAAAWALDSIRLPSGGALKMQYESDDYAWVQNKRAAQLFRVIGTGSTAQFNQRSSDLYTKTLLTQYDHRYVFIRVPKPVNNRLELYHTYLAGLKKLYFRISVKVPSDNYGSGYETIPCYADLEADSNYGVVNSQVIWVKLAGISLKGDEPGSYSPLVKAATQFLRLNLPSKAYPGSETGDKLDMGEAVMMLMSMATNITTAIKGYDKDTRDHHRVKQLDTLRSFVRLNNPFLKKMGGGHRVKRITVYDHWDKMAKKDGQPKVRPAVYGQEYSYTNAWTVNGDTVTGSSGVAIWEPGIGGEENPFRVPVEYVEKIAPLGPVTLGYSEEPLGESFFPGASVGYSNVRVRTINYKNRKSANGFEETKFYTAYDYPIYVDRTFLDDATKKRYKPELKNLLRIKAYHYLSLSQGFKIELNDMHGKMRAQASYAETNTRTPISYSEQFYKTDTTVPGFRRLSNQVTVMRPDGIIDTAALIGKDVELMMDMREQYSVSHAVNLPFNTDWFSIPFVPPTFLLPTAMNLLQREENIFRSVATTKIIQRYGILDSAIQVDKGSRISTHDLLYDSETGDVLLTRTQNEFNDPVFNFTYPSHWAYDGMGLAYKNIDATLRNITIRDGKLVGMTAAQEKLFASGDEILVAGKQLTTDLPGCVNDTIATFSDYNKIWAVDSSVLYGGPRAIYFIDRWGKAYNAYDVSLRIIRSGRRNILGAVGSVTSLDSLVRKNTAGNYELVVNTNSKIIAASAGEFRQFWKTDDVLRKQKTMTCLPNRQPNGYVECIRSGGIYTGYQRIQLEDMNPLSPSYQQKTWDTLFNCAECPRPAKWMVQANTFQCAQDSAGNNLGFQYQGELDTASCSATYGQYRWKIVVPGKCAECPKPVKWEYAAYDSCQKINGVNTGYVLRKQVNTESCSSNPGAIRWVRDTANCTLCPKPVDWWKIDTFRCELVNGIKTGYAEQLEINREPCLNNDSAARWVKLPERRCDLCGTPSNYQVVGDTCQLDGNGKKTGYKYNIEKDLAPCSPTFNDTNWVFVPDRDCIRCVAPSNYQVVGDTCQLDGNGKKTGYKYNIEKDLAPCSPTFNDTNWVFVPDRDCIRCVAPSNYQVVGDTCQLDGNGKKTGYKYNIEKDLAPCSPTFNDTNWVFMPGQDCTRCKKDKNWQYVTGDTCTKDGNGNNTGYRARRQQNMESCSDSAGMYRWVSSYDPTACPVTPSCVYVKVVADTIFNSLNEKTGKITFQFYSNAAKTIPISVTNLNFNYTIENWEDGVLIGTSTINITCSGTEKVLGTHIQFYLDDPNASPRVIYKWKYDVPSGTNICGET